MKAGHEVDPERPLVSCAAMADYRMVSGFGQFHTDEVDPDNPGKKRTPYTPISWDEICELADQPQCVDKAQAQWVIPSSLPSRSFKAQETDGQFWMLWADLDKVTEPLEQIRATLEPLIGDADFEIYTSRSATEERPKCRILIPLDEPLCGGDWEQAQQVFNDKLEAAGIEPDRASERPAQLCYLPNRGKHYASCSRRDGNRFDPMREWAKEITAKRQAIADADAALEARKEAASERRMALSATQVTSTSRSIFEAFNAAWSVEEILEMAGYERRGDKFRHPKSESGSFSGMIKGGRFHSLSPRDLAYTGGGGGGAHDAFSLFTLYMHGGDINAALKDAGDNWLSIEGESWNKHVRRKYAQAQAQAQPLVSVDKLLAKARGADQLARRFQMMSADELAALLPARERVVGVLSQEGIAALFGPPSSAKSFLAVDMGVHIAAGEEWFGHRVEACPVTMVVLEGERGIAKRMAAYRDRHGPIPTGLRFIASSPLSLLSDADVDELAEDVRAQGGADGVVIIDTLSRASVGADENSSADMGRIIAGAKALQAALGGVVVLVHHTGKNTAAGLRGHSSLLAALDTSIEVSRDGESASRQWTVAKSKDGEDGGVHPFQLEVVDLGENKYGDRITSCVVVPGAGQGEPRGAEFAAKVKAEQLEQERAEVLQRMRAEVLQKVRDARAADLPLSKREARARIKGKTQVVLDCINDLVADAWLVEIDVPPKDRTNASRKSFLISLATDERQTYLDSGRLPAAKAEVPTSWKRAPDPEIPVVPASEQSEASKC